MKFAHDVLGVTLAIYVGDKDAPVFELLSAASPGVEASLARDEDLVVQLERGASMIPGGIAVALRAAPSEMIGVMLAVGSALDAEVVGELAFDLEGVLAARMMSRLRAEELAVLEIQERELVGLLRDVEARDAIIQRDLEEARGFQHQMLGTPPRVDGASIEMIYQPLGLVGGDLYATSVEGSRLRVFVADATGHGIRASLTTMFIKSSYDAVSRAAADPAAVLALLNDTIAGTYGSLEMLFTAACVDVDLVTGRCLSASGGHPEACVVIDGKASFVDGVGPLLGFKRGLAFTNRELVLGRGDGVYVYTDGFVEARNGNVLFGSERFRKVIAEAHTDGRPAGQAIVDAVAAFLDGKSLADDGTFVGVRRA